MGFLLVHVALTSSFSQTFSGTALTVSIKGGIGTGALGVYIIYCISVNC